MKIGICAIMKDINPKYFLEWIEWHEKIGVSYFFIYDNDSAIPIQVSLEQQQYIKVLLIHGKQQQCNAYNDCTKKIKGGLFPNCDWVAFIDDDEFIVLESGNLTDLLSTQINSGVALNWIVYGASKDEDFDKPQMEKYKNHFPLNHEWHKHIKSIVNPFKVAQWTNPHYCHYIKGGCVDMQERTVVGPFTKTPYHEKAWINHYYVRSRKEFELKIQRGRSDNKSGIYPEQITYDFIENQMKKLPLRVGDMFQGLQDLCLYAINNMNSNEIAIEIGAFVGGGTLILAKHFEKVIVIDPFVSGYDTTDSSSRENMEQIYDQFKENTAHLSNVTLIRKTSDDAMKELQDLKVDFVYIDGCHTYDQVLKDIQNYKPLVKSNGYISGHDYQLRFKGVIKAVNQLIGSPEKVFEDTSWCKKAVLPKIALITPTGGRPKQVDYIASYMKSQDYTGKVLWLITDDVIPFTTDFLQEGFKANWTIEKLYPEPYWQECENTQARNLLVAIEALEKRTDIDYVFIIEDDDYYKPNYLSKMISLFGDHKLIGQKGTSYYNVTTKQIRRMPNERHSSLFQTAFSIELLSTFKKVVESNHKFIDFVFWKEVGGFLFNDNLSIGIKGLSGRKGIGIGHKKEKLAKIPQINQEVLKQIFGEDFINYAEQ